MKKILAIIALMLPIMTISLNAQVSVNPAITFIDPLSKTGSAELHNNSDDLVEAEVSFMFAYESFSDTLNQIILIRDDSVTKSKYDLAPYIRVFPKKVILQPRKKQTIRFLVKNVNKLDDGTYWTRIVVKSKKHEIAVSDSAEIEDSIKLGFITWYHMSFPLYFQKGDINTNIDISNIKSVRYKEKLALEMDLKRIGNSPFWGIIKMEIYDVEDDDEPIEISRHLLPIFKDHNRRFMLQDSKYKSGKKYRVEIIVNNDGLSDIVSIPYERLIDVGEFESSFEFICP